MLSLVSLAPLSHGHPFGEPCDLTDFPYILLSWDPFAGAADEWTDVGGVGGTMTDGGETRAGAVARGSGE